MSEGGEVRYEILYYGELVWPRVDGPMYKREWRKGDAPFKEESDDVSN